MSGSFWAHGLQSMEFSRPEYWRGQPSPGYPTNPGIQPRSPTLQVDSLPAEPHRSPRMLEWVTYPFSSRSSWLRDPTQVSHIAGGFFIDWAIRDARSPLVPPTNLWFFFSPEIKGVWSFWGHLACIPSLSSRFISEASLLPDNLSLMWQYTSFSMCSLRAFRHPPLWQKVKRN